MTTAPVRTLEERLTRAQVAERLQVSTRTIDRLVRTGSLRAERLPGGAVRFRASAVDRMIDQATRAARSFFGGVKQA